MHSFKDFGIKVETQSFTGDKIKVERILNKEITVHAYKIEESKFKDKGYPKCLHLQISIGDDKRVVFTSAISLRTAIDQVPKDKFPFKTTIVKQTERFEFT